MDIDLSSATTEISTFLIALKNDDSDFIAPAGISSAYQENLTSDAWSLFYSRRGWVREETQQSNPSAATLILGEGQDYRADDSLPFMGCAASIRHDVQNRTLCVCSAITGLPPIFQYRDRELTLLASSVDAIAKYPGITLHFDPKALFELATVGFPLDYRTLFTQIAVLPPGASLAIDGRGQLHEMDAWEAPESNSLADSHDHLDQLADLLEQAVGRMDVENSFLSLTAGIDTRAIFAILQQQDSNLPAYTITGPRPSIDALRARELCDAYDLPFSAITLDAKFETSLPELAETASRMSGGLVSIGETPDVYMYQNVVPGIGARVCGNLGNQVGRGGTEGVSLRNVDKSLLGQWLQESGHTEPDGHWILSRTENSGFDLRFLIQEENLFSTLGGNCIASAFATQQMPYADRSLIELAMSKTKLLKSNPRSVFAIKLRDLRHRFLGPDKNSSFQLKCILAGSGPVTDIPINWGWKPSGGVSVSATTLGMFALFDALFGSRQGFSAPMEWLGIRGLSEFRNSDTFINPRFREFSRDLLSSNEIRETGIFNNNELKKLTDQELSERNRYTDLVFATDIALAAKTFRATL